MKNNKFFIAIDAKRAFNNLTGLGNYSRYILNLLAKSPFKEQILAFTPEIKTNRFKEFPSKKVRVKQSKWPNSLWRSFFITKQLKNDSVKLYHGLSNEIPFGLKKTTIKSVVTIHDLIFLRYPNYYPFIDRLIYNFKFKYACKNADKIIAISEKTKEDIIHFYGINEHKIEVIYQSCSPIFCLPATKKTPTKPYIISVGTIEDRKNQLSLVKAFHLLNTTDVDLILVGKGKTYKKSVKAYIETNSIKNIKIMSGVSNEELVSLYQNALFAAYVSKYEGFGIPIIEAINTGLPVLAATGSCLEEAGGGGCLYVNPNSINEIQEALKSLIKNNNLRATLIEAGTTHIQKFNDQHIANQLVNLYKDVLNSNT